MRACVLGVAAGLVACGGGGGDPAAIDASAPDAAWPDAPPATVTISGQCIDYVSMMPVEGAQVTVVDRPEIPAVLSDATGAYALPGVPAFAQVTLRFEKEAYMPVVTRQLQLGGGDYQMYQGRGFEAMVTRAAVDVIESLLGTTRDPTKGAVVARLEDATTLMGLAGATMALTPAPEDGPVYFNDSQIPDPALTMTSTAGLGLFHNVVPGDTLVTLTSATRPSCVATGDDAPPAPLTIKVYADTTTWIPFLCSP